MLRTGKPEPLSRIPKNLLERSLIRKDKQRLSYGLQATGWGLVLGNALYKHQKQGEGGGKLSEADLEKHLKTAKIFDQQKVYEMLSECHPVQSLCAIVPQSL